MSRPSEVIVLVEDERQQRFVRRYLSKLGYLNHQLRLEPLPGNRGCGEQWVRDRYAKEVKAYRSRSTRARTALVVAIDADTLDVIRRHDQLRDALAGAGLTPRTDTEPIVHLVPKRNIETWILCLNGRNVDENADFSRDGDIDGQIPDAALVFFGWSRANAAPPGHSVPSLLSAIPEVRRMERSS